MASRSRKRRPPPDEPAGSLEPGPSRRPTTAAAHDPVAEPVAPGAGGRGAALLELDPMARRYARSRARDEAVRRGLVPLAPGERPRVVTIAAIVALGFAIANVVATLTVDDLSTDQGDPTLFAIVTTAILVLAAAGMLARRYWAVLGFECILGLQIVVFSLALTRVQKWWLALAMVVAIGLLGVLFWKLIRAMARLQMPVRGGPAEPTR